MFKEYYRLAKPGIVYGNTFTTIAAFLFASGWHFTSALVVIFIATVIGIAFVIGSACVLNNYLDRDLDAHMERTKKRALVTGSISARSACIYSALLGILGFYLLYFWVNALTAEVALFGFVTYVVVYGFAKRVSPWGALVGSVPGAVSIVVGYTAVMATLDATALVLFFILVAWQMPHFYAIALYRIDEYKKAGIPVFPAVHGIAVTKLHILIFTVLYVCAAVSLVVIGQAGYSYFVCVFAFGLLWLWRAIEGLTSDADPTWAKGFFFLSLVVLMSFCIALAVSPLLP